MSVTVLRPKCGDDFCGGSITNDVIMSTMASQITNLTVVYSTVYSDADQRKDQSFALLAFVWGIHQDRWIPCTKGQLRGKCFHLMTSSCVAVPYLHIIFGTNTAPADAYRELTYYSISMGLLPDT